MLNCHIVKLLVMKIVIVVPCYNEEAVLEKNVKQVYEAAKNLSHDIKIVISDNNSRDRTAEIGKQLAAEWSNVDYVLVGEPGKGAAVMEAWKQYDADIFGFMDADLATDLEALPRAVAEIAAGNDAAIGSRRIAGAKVWRGALRKFVSAVLNLIVRFFFKTKIKDTACGFKFFRREIIEKIMPQVRDRQWFFDTELVLLSERAGYKTKELPVTWRERGERESRVNIYPTAIGYLKNILELRRRIGSRF